MIDPVVIMTDAPTPEDRAIISDGLAAFSRDQIGCWNARPLAVLVSDRLSEPC
jgi:hypothetical protein